jgi:inorganic phosphate transporter, PiT family
MISAVLLALAAALSFIFGWNNSSFLIGNVRSSGTFSLTAAMTISTLGLVSGVVLQSGRMAKSIDGSLASTPTVHGLVVTFVITIAVTAGLTLLDLPVSFTATLVGAFLAVDFVSKLHINLPDVSLVIFFWFAAPLLAGVVAFGFHRVITRVLSNVGLIATDSFNRFGVVVSGLTVSFALGANNVGPIYGTAMGGVLSPDYLGVALLMVLVAVVGMVVLGRGSLSGTLGDKLLSLSPHGVLSVFVSSAILVEVGTLLGVPISISQCLLGSMLGAAFSQHIAIINKKVAYEALSMMVTVPLIAFLLAYAVMSL